MTKFMSRMDGAESLGPTGGPSTVKPAPQVGVPFTTNAETSDFSNNAIPDHPGAETGLLGVKAPFSPRQTGEIEDRLRAAGVKSPYEHDKF